MQKLIRFCALILPIWLVSCNYIKNSVHSKLGQCSNQLSKDERSVPNEKVNCDLQTKYRKILPASYANFYSQSTNSYLEDMQNKPLSSKSTKDLKIDDCVSFKIDTESLLSKSTKSIINESKKKPNFAKKNKEPCSRLQESVLSSTSKHQPRLLPKPLSKRFYSTFNPCTKKPKSVWIERYLKNLSNTKSEVKDISSPKKKSESSFANQQSMASSEKLSVSKLEEHGKKTYSNMVNERNARIAKIRELKYKKMMNTIDLYCERIDQCEGCKHVTSLKKTNSKHQ